MFYHNYKTGFSSGMRVRVVSQHKYRNTNLVGKLGTVRTGYGTEISVRLDGMSNPYAATGLYYFKPAEIVLVDEHDNTVEENNNMPKITNYLNAVKIQYLDNTTPNSCIYANFIADIKVGDTCVIKSAHHGLGLAKIVEILDRNDFEITSREVVAVVDTRDYDESVANRAKAAELMDKMRERAKKLQDIALYQMLAENDPDMANLLQEYKGLNAV